jgi:thiol-disulfide isomerase/thioredoxin
MVFLPAHGAEIPWTDNVKQALSEAAASGKPLFIDAWAIWCVPCKEMDETTYRDPLVVERMKAFVPLKVDQDVQEIFCEKHSIEALPQVLFLDGEGREIARRMGLLRAPELLGIMSDVEEGYAAYLEAVARPEDPAAARAAASYLLEAGNAEGASNLARKPLKSRDVSAEQREPLELLVARAQLAAEDWSAAAKSLERLVETATLPAVKAAALQGLVEAHRARGRTADADRALERLRAEFPQPER